MTKYGYTTVGIIAIAAFILVAIGVLLNNNYIRIFLIVAAILLLTFTLNFFRDPDRTPPNRDDVVVSPADGKVIVVKEVFENKFLNEKAWQISIFMSPLNVHVNRMPVSGKIDYLNYIKGDYLVASDDKASEKNERAEFGISSKYGKMLFTQVAGYIARRIVYETKMGEDVKIGQRFGMIKFGSRVDVIVPYNWRPMVKKGSKVTAGETILFEYGK